MHGLHKGRGFSTVLSGLLCLAWALTANAQGSQYDFWKRYSQVYDAGKNFLEHTARGQGLVGLQQGAYSYRWELPVPPGRSGVAPSVALLYSSNAGRSPWGYGWTVSAPRIERSTKFGAPRYDDYGSDSDQFVFIDENGSAHDLVPVALDGNKARYRRMIESTMDWYIFDRSTNRWTILSKDGAKRRFGEPTLEALSYVDGKGIFAWYIDSHEDSTGNTIVYDYLRVNGVDVFPETIQYTGNSQMVGEPGWSAAHEIRFNYTSGAGRIIDCRRGLCATLDTKKPTSIEIRTLGQIRKRFSIVYSSIENQDVLQQIQFTAWDATGTQATLPAVAFTYGNAAPSFASQSTVSISPSLGVDRDAWQRTVSFGSFMPSGEYFDPDGKIFTTRTMTDMNGDGLKDIVTSMMPGAPDYDCHFKIHFGQLDANGVLSYVSPDPGGEWEAPVGFGYNHDEVPGEPDPTWRCAIRWSDGTTATTTVAYQDLMDVTGDGRADIVKFNKHPVTLDYEFQIYENNGSGFNAVEIWAMPHPKGLRREFLSWLASYCQANCTRMTYDLADLNGDSLPDLIDTTYWSAENQNFLVWTNNSQGFEAPVIWPSPYPTTYTMRQETGGIDAPTLSGMQLQDMNGDGLADLLVFHQDLLVGNYGPLKVALNNGSGFETAITWLDSSGPIAVYTNHVTSIPPITTTNSFANQYVEDANGDGLPDLLKRVSSSEWRVYRNHGDGFDTTYLAITDLPEYVNSQVGVTHAGDQFMLHATSHGRNSLVDLNGDRRLDVLMASDTYGSWNVRMGVFTPAFRLTSVENGYQGSADIAYRSSVRTVGHQNPNPTIIVESETTNDGQFPGHEENSIVREFEYEDGLFVSSAEDFYACHNHEFRGFGKVTEIVEAKDLEVLHRYYQDAYRKGMEISSRWAQRSNPVDAEYLKAIDLTYQGQAAGSGLWQFPDSILYSLSATEERVSNNDDYLRHTRKTTSSTYDPDGNLTSRTDSGVVERRGSSELGNARKVDFTYKSSVDLALEKYLWAVKTEVGTWRDAAGVWNSQYSKQFFHDENADINAVSRGLLTKLKELVAGDPVGYWIERFVAYHKNSSLVPAGGLVANETDFRGNTTHYTYDSATQALVATKQKGSLAEAFVYDPSLGLVTSRTDENGKVWGFTYL